MTNPQHHGGHFKESHTQIAVRFPQHLHSKSQRSHVCTARFHMEPRGTSVWDMDLFLQGPAKKPSGRGASARSRCRTWWDASTLGNQRFRAQRTWSHMKELQCLWVFGHGVTGKSFGVVGGGGGQEKTGWYLKEATAPGCASRDRVRPWDPCDSMAL